MDTYRRVKKLLQCGLMDIEIAKLLGKSPHTIAWYRNKIGVKSNKSLRKHFSFLYICMLLEIHGPMWSVELYKYMNHDSVRTIYHIYKGYIKRIRYHKNVLYYLPEQEQKAIEMFSNKVKCLKKYVYQQI